MIEIRMSTAPASSVIEAELKLHPDSQTLQDEWGGITNPQLRRKLQNRLNQRAARRRKAESQRQADGSLGMVCENRTVQDDHWRMIAERAKSAERWLEPVGARGYSSTAFRSIRDADSCQPRMAVMVHDRINQVQSLYKRIMSERDGHAKLPADHLLSLVYYNVYRALIANVAVLGLDLDLMSTDEYPSPFTPCSPTATSALRSLPPTLQPTLLQQLVAHHPQWDIIPDPICRDNILLRGRDVDINDVELCLDLIGTEERRCRAEKNSQSAGCIVWGDPWNLDSWEVTEEFVKKYPWMFVGATDLEKSTNAHRQKRDESPIRFVELGAEACCG